MPSPETGAKPEGNPTPTPQRNRWTRSRTWLRERKLSEFGALVSVIATAASLVLAFTSSLRSDLGKHGTAGVWLALLSGVVIGLVISGTQLLSNAAKRETKLAGAIDALDRLRANAEAPVARALMEFATLAHDAEAQEWNCADLPTEKLQAEVQQLLDRLVEAYKVITGLTYRASIKYFESAELNGAPILVARTLARSGGPDDIDKDDFFVVRDNTAFANIYIYRRTHFFSNDLYALAEQGRYGNTRVGWQSRYRSAIVWKLENKDGKFGACCVDTRAANGFDELRDVNLGWIFVDSVKNLATVLIGRTKVSCGSDPERNQSPSQGDT